MAFLDHSAQCNRRDMTRFRPFVIDGAGPVGWVRHDMAGELRDLHPALTVSEAAVTLTAASPEARSQALRAICAGLVERGTLPALRGEDYAVKAHWAAPELARIDRGAVSLFGLRAWGLHVNGVVRQGDQLHLWVGRRAPDKTVAPDKLDNLVAGGQPAGLTLHDNLLKESAEEADIPAPLAATAIPVGLVTYCFEDERGLKPDTLFCYDLHLPADFVPRNTDGELVGFELWPARRVLDAVRDSDEFKFNVNLVILDFALRHGLLTPDDEPAYEAIAAGLRTTLP